MVLGSRQWTPAAPVSLPQAALAVWPIILRFMGDLPEPVLYAKNSVQGGPVMRQIHATLSQEGTAQGPRHSGSVQVSGTKERGMIWAGQRGGHRSLSCVPPRILPQQTRAPECAVLNCI